MSKKEPSIHNYPPEENTGGILLILTILLAFILFKGLKTKVEKDTEEFKKIELTKGEMK